MRAVQKLAFVVSPLSAVYSQQGLPTRSYRNQDADPPHFSGSLCGWQPLPKFEHTSKCVMNISHRDPFLFSGYNGLLSFEATLCLPPLSAAIFSVPQCTAHFHQQQVSYVPSQQHIYWSPELSRKLS